MTTPKKHTPETGMENGHNQNLFNLLKEKFNFIALQSDMHEILDAVNADKQSTPSPKPDFIPCGEGDNTCNCKSADECGYLAKEDDVRSPKPEMSLVTKDDITKAIRKGTDISEIADNILELYALQKQAGEWIKVENQLPKEGVDVLWATKNGRISYNNWQSFTSQDADWFRSIYTHWLPIPNPPVTNQ